MVIIDQVLIISIFTKMQQMLFRRHIKKSVLPSTHKIFPFAFSIPNYHHVNKPATLSKKLISLINVFTDLWY